MKKTVFLILLLCTILITGCVHRYTGHELIGMWEHDGIIYEFTPDGELVVGDQRYSFSAFDGEVNIDKNGETVRLEYAINSNGTLSLGDNTFYPIKS